MLTHSEALILRWIEAVFPFSSARCQPLEWLDAEWQWQDQMQLWRSVATHCDKSGLVGLKELLSRDQAETLLRFMWAHSFDFVCGEAWRHGRTCSGWYSRSRSVFRRARVRRLVRHRHSHGLPILERRPRHW